LINKERNADLITLRDPNYALNYYDRILLLEDGKIMAEFYTKEMGGISRQNIHKYIW